MKARAEQAKHDLIQKAREAATKEIQRYQGIYNIMLKYIIYTNMQIKIWGYIESYCLLRYGLFSGVMVSMLALSVVDHRFESWLG